MFNPAERKDRLPLLLSLLLLFCLVAGISAGCSNPLDDPGEDGSENLGQVESGLRLNACELRPLTLSGEVSSVRYPIVDQQIALPAKGFSLDLSFNQEIDFSSAQAAVILKDCQDEYTVRQYEKALNMSNVVNVFVPSIAPGEYTLEITAGLKDINGQSLEAPASIRLVIEHQTAAEFFLLDSSGLPRPLSYRECENGLSLTDTAKTFVIHFDEEVTQSSVEDSIKAGLQENPVSVSFAWLTPQQLRVSLEQLQTGLGYHLRLDKALDKKGNAIIGSCYFRTGKASNLGVIDLSTYNMSMLYQFSEERYSALRDQDIDNQVLLQAGFASTWSFGLGTKQITALPDLRFDLAIPQRYPEPIWLNFNALLAYDTAKKALCRVSVSDGSLETLLTLEEAPLECRLAPNGKWLAMTVKSKENGKVDLLIIDLEAKKESQRLTGFAESYSNAEGYQTINLTWAADDALLFSDGDDIMKAYVTEEGKVMSRTNTYQKNARLLCCLPDMDLTLYRSTSGKGNEIYLLENDKARRVKGLLADVERFYCLLIDSGTILYQQGQEIRRFDIADQESQLLGNGQLLGISTDHTKGYYMANSEEKSEVLGP